MPAYAGSSKNLKDLLAQRLHPLLVASLRRPHLAETKTRLAFYREKAVRFFDLASPLEVPRGFLWPVE